MNTSHARLALAFVLLTTQTIAQQEPSGDKWARYRPGTLSNVIQGHSYAATSRDKGAVLGSDPVRVRVTYTGRSRAISAAKRLFIAFYMESVGIPEYTEKFITEMLIIEGGVEFWLPVRDALLPSFEKEMNKGESIILFANWIGITYSKRDGRGLHVFLVNEFEKSEVSNTALTATDQWKTLTSPDKDFTVDFPAKPDRDEFRGKTSFGKAGRLIRRYFVYTDSQMLAISFQDLEYAPNSQFANSVASSYEQKIKEVAKRDGWKIVRIQRLSNSVAETEAWDRAGASGGYVHAISRTVVRNGQAYDLQCRSVFIGLEVDRGICSRFFNSFHVVGPPR